MCFCLQKNQYNNESMFNQSHARQLLFLLANYLNPEYVKTISKDSVQSITDLILEEN